MSPYLVMPRDSSFHKKKWGKSTITLISIVNRISKLLKAACIELIVLSDKSPHKNPFNKTFSPEWVSEYMCHSACHEPQLWVRCVTPGILKRKLLENYVTTKVPKGQQRVRAHHVVALIHVSRFSLASGWQFCVDGHLLLKMQGNILNCWFIFMSMLHINKLFHILW